MNLKEKFFELSLKLTEIDELSRATSNMFFDQLIIQYPDQLEKLLVNFETTIEKRLNQVILYLWYTSELILPEEIDDFFNPENKSFRKIESKSDSPTPYYESLVWKAAKAHPPALTGGYFGYWKYLPEN